MDINNKIYDTSYLEGDITLYQEVDAFRYGTDALLLSKFFIDEFSGSPKKKILEIGSGCGVIPIYICKHIPDLYIDTIDIQEDSTAITKKNIVENNLKERISPLNGDVKSYEMGNTYDIIISNPPYMPTNGMRKNDSLKKTIARHEVSLDLFEFISQSKRLLKPRGELYFIHRAHRLQDIIVALSNNNFSLSKLIFISPNENKNANLLLVKATKGKKAHLEVPKTLFLNKSNY